MTKNKKILISSILATIIAIPAFAATQVSFKDGDINISLKEETSKSVNLTEYVNNGTADDLNYTVTDLTDKTFFNLSDDNKTLNITDKTPVGEYELDMKVCGTEEATDNGINRLKTDVPFSPPPA